MAAADRNLSMVWWQWHISVSHLCCCCWPMVVFSWVASIIVCVCFGVPSQECWNIKFLVKLSKSGSEKRDMLVQVYGDKAMKKTTVYICVTFFWRKRMCHWWSEMRTASNKQNWRKHCKSASNCIWKSSADCQEHSRGSEHWQRNSKTLTDDLDISKVGAKMVPKDLLTQHCLWESF
jgi:hypothetical protein